MYNREYLEIQSPGEEKRVKGWVKPALLLLVAVGVVAALYTTQGNVLLPTGEKSLSNAVSKAAVHSALYTTIACDDPPQIATVSSNAQDFYHLTVPANAKEIIIDTCNSELDTFLYLYKGHVESEGGDFYSCDDCGACGVQTVLDVPVVSSGATDMEFNAREKYTIGVGGYSGMGGPYQIQLRCARGGGGEATPPPETTTSQPPPIETTSPPVETTSPPVETTSRPVEPTHPPDETTSPPIQPGECNGPRVRKSWHRSTQAERNLYINGFLELKRIGKIEVFTATHLHNINGMQAHGTPQFLPWHRLYLWELENQFRALGPNYRCFALPYWDWTINSANAYANPMFAQGLGGANGGQSCVDGAFAPPYTDSYGNCLRRGYCTESCWGVVPYESASEMVGAVIASSSYLPFQEALEAGPHSAAHLSLSYQDGAQIGMFWAPDDPYFFLLHGMVDFQWAMWQDCFGYDDLPVRSNPNIFPRNKLDEVLEFYELKRQTWSYVSNHEVKSFQMHDITGGLGGVLNYKFEGGDLLTRSGQDVSGICTFGPEGNVVFSPTLVADERPLHSISRMVEREARQWRASLDRGVSPVGFVIENVANLNERERCTHVAQMACKRTRSLCIERRLIKPCVFSSDYEKCGGAYGSRKYISLEDLKKKRGVAGNPCLMAVRDTYYRWASGLGLLRELCNGRFDPRCSD